MTWSMHTTSLTERAHDILLVVEACYGRADRAAGDQHTAARWQQKGDQLLDTYVTALLSPTKEPL